LLFLITINFHCTRIFNIDVEVTHSFFVIFFLFVLVLTVFVILIAVLLK